VQQLVKVLLTEPKRLALKHLRRIYEARADIFGAVSEDSGCLVAKEKLFQLLANEVSKKGEHLIALDILREGHLELPDDSSITRQLALCLAATGNTQQAIELLLHHKGKFGEDQSDPETEGALARCYKDLAARFTISDKEKKLYLQKAFTIYHASYLNQQNYYTGINAASMAFLLQKNESAFTLGKAVRALCNKELERGPCDYWLLATLGEAAVQLGNFDEAEDYYKQAVAYAAGDSMMLQSSVRQLRKLVDQHKNNCCENSSPGTDYSHRLIQGIYIGSRCSQYSQCSTPKQRLTSFDSLLPLPRHYASSSRFPSPRLDPIYQMSNCSFPKLSVSLGR
jgi:hypothetical protein